MKKMILILGLAICYLISYSQQQGTFKDPRDGKIYKTVIIGTQTWFAENLKTTKFNDGTPIPNVVENKEWIERWILQLSTAGTAPAYCNYKNTTNSDTINIYGRFYNWYVADSTSNGHKNVCPSGWHVPSDAEWSLLIDYLGGSDKVGGQLKEVGTAHWNSPNNGATNTSGFTALPTGYRHDIDGTFRFAGMECYWWSRSQLNESLAWLRGISYNHANIGRYSFGKDTGYSIRCLKDQ